MKLKVSDYISGLKERRIDILSRAITLIESSRADHKELALELLSALSKDEVLCTREQHTTVIGFSGPPGVGKSTFIEAFGLKLIERKKSLGVLAIDPSSSITGGSILGDKTRMSELAKLAFIRPSASASTLGGVALKTKESISLCKSYGFDYIFVETVGVGQSEIHVARLVDIFCLLMQPAAGDELQAIKRGVLELADIIIVNKADGELLKKAKIAQSQLQDTLQILRHKEVPTFLVSALYGEGLSDFATFFERELGKSSFGEKRKAQSLLWAKSFIDELAFNTLLNHKNFNELKERLVTKLLKNQLSMSEAQDAIKKVLFNGD